MNRYILLNGIVNNANPVSSHYTIGLPSLTAFHGFLYSLLIDSKIDIKDLKTFWIGLKNVNLSPGNLRISNQTKGAPSDKIIAPPISELSKTLDFDFSIIIELNSECSLDMKKINNVLKGKKLAGGSLFNAEAISSSDDSFIKLLENISPKTIFLKDETNILNEEIDFTEEDILKEENLSETEKNKYYSLLDLKDKDPFDRMIYYIRKELNHKDKSFKSWYTPINIGFKLIEEPTDDRDHLIRGVKAPDGNFAKYKHAYSEPVIGIVKSVRKNKLIELLKTESIYSFGFKAYFNKESNQFLILNKEYQF